MCGKQRFLEVVGFEYYSLLSNQVRLLEVLYRSSAFYIFKFRLSLFVAAR